MVSPRTAPGLEPFRCRSEWWLDGRRRIAGGDGRARL